MAAHVNRKLYWAIFGYLFGLTVLEVLVALPVFRDHLGMAVVGGALVAMAIAKATLVGLFYMHLSHETPILKLTVAVPLVAPAIYAIVLVGEATWRIANGQLQGAFP